MIYKKGSWWKVVGSAKKYRTKAEAKKNANIEKGYSYGQDSPKREVSESTDRGVPGPTGNRADTVADGDNQCSELGEV